MAPVRRIEFEPTSGFGLANLPYGVFSTGDDRPRPCTRLGETVVDLSLVLDDPVFAEPTLNPFMAQGRDSWVAVRAELTERLQRDLPEAALHAIGDVRLHLPIDVADYVDFYASEHHASNLGRLFRPDNPDPLQPNWKHLPVGYHGRAASIVVSGTDIVRPSGQRLIDGAMPPQFGPSLRLDIEAEIGFIVGTPSKPGQRISTADAEKHLFGAVVFNDWSARDIQAWEYVPLGPNLGKSFASTISPWVITMLALESSRVEIPRQDPKPLPYLAMEPAWGLDLDMEVEWNGHTVSRPPYREMYWSPAQMLAHLSVNGAPISTGDLFASGTVSGVEPATRGAFIELTWGGAEPVMVGSEPRTFLEDDDTIVISASASNSAGERIDFGAAAGRVVPALPFD